MADGFVEVTPKNIATADGVREINRMLRAVFDMVAGDGINVRVLHGYGTPEGAVKADIGALFLRKDGGANTTLYVKESGTGDTGWVAK
jgi:hypothetical protein